VHEVMEEPLRADNPTFTIFTGCMFSAKTSKLLLELERYKYQHKTVAVFKPQIDNRYSTEDIVSHGGVRATANCVTNGACILKYLVDLDVSPSAIAVDEAFMLPGVAEVLIWLYKSGFSIIVSSLDLSAQGKPFKEIEKMMPWATHIEKCAAVCVVCGKDAHYTYKKQGSGNEIEVGGVELYEPRCLSCHPTLNVAIE